MKQKGPYIGIDVAKAHLDLAVHLSGDAWRVTNDYAGINAIVTRLREMDPTLVVVEPTGGLELPLTAALAAAGLPLAVVNPRQVRDFAKATGRLAKTDRLDAQVLAHFAQAVQPTPRPLPDAQTQELSALLARRQQLVGFFQRGCDDPSFPSASHDLESIGLSHPGNYTHIPFSQDTRIFKSSPWQTLRYAQGDIWVAPFKPETSCGRYFRGKAATMGNSAWSGSGPLPGSTHLGLPVSARQRTLLLQEFPSLLEPCRCRSLAAAPDRRWSIGDFSRPTPWLLP